MESKKRNRLGNIISETKGVIINSLANGPEHEELEKLLECSSCQKIPLPPIYTCETGHAACYQCQLKLTGCPICNEPFRGTRSFSLETIVRTSLFHCNHKHEGCQQQLSAEEFTDHHNSCRFRPMTCHLSGLEGCEDTLLYLSEYVDHLKNIHELTSYWPQVDWKNNLFKIHFEDKAWNDDPESNCGRSWPSSLLNFNGNVFLTQVHSNGDTYYFGLVIIANKLEAAKYAVSISIPKKNDPLYKYELTTTVPSIRELQDSIAVEDLPYAALDKELLERFGVVTSQPDDFIEEDDEEIKFTLDIQYEIKTLNSSSVSSCHVM